MPINGPNIIIEDFNIHMLTQSPPNNLPNIAKILWEVKSSKPTTIYKLTIYGQMPLELNNAHFISTQASLYKPQNQYTSHWNCQIMCPVSSHNSIVSHSSIRLNLKALTNLFEACMIIIVIIIIRWPYLR